MNRTFSFRRIGYILRADFTEHKMEILFRSICYVAIWGVFSSYSVNPGNIVSLFYIILIMSGAGYCLYAGRKLHQGKGMFLTLPATNAEKYTALLIEGLAGLLVFNLLFWMGIRLGCFLSGNGMITFAGVYGALSVTKVSVALFFFTLLLVFHATFRKMALLLYLITIALVTGLVTFIGVRTFILTFNDMEHMHRINTDTFFAPLYYLYRYGSAILFAASAGFLYLVYYKLKRKQLR